ncbi:TPA: DUF2570 domain-containing protein [Serratia marcescens]|nr:DUF2570 domain-containing protein [Serratia marcescens]
MKAAAVLILLFLAALAGMGWQKYQRELAEQRRDIAERAVEQTGDVLAEVRALRADVGEIEAGMKKLSEKRGTNGEQRRETIKTALAGETCAVTPVPAAVADSLQKRAAEVRAADYSGAFAGQPDGKH